MFTLKGRWNRLNRLSFFVLAIMAVALSYVCSILALALINFGLGDGFSGDEAQLFIDLGTGALSLWMFICLSVKRLHDVGKQGLYFILLLIPIINLVFLLCLLFMKGEEGENQYGADPLKQANRSFGII